MRSTTPPELHGRCARCFLPHGLCLCPELPRLAFDTRFVVIRHAKQAWKTSNTARFAPLVLANSQLLHYGGQGGAFEGGFLAAPDTCLLFPGNPPGLPHPRPSRVVVLDGSWSQARRMAQRVPALRGMPRLSLPAAAPGTPRLRRPPHPDGMSTLEAIAYAVALLEGEAAARPLHWVHREHVRRVRLARGRRSDAADDARATG